MHDPKKIMMMHGSSDIYGASKILYITAKLLQQQRHTVTVVLSEEGPLAEQLRAEHIDVVIIRLGILRRKYFTVKGLFNRATVLYKARKVLETLVKEKQTDIIYSNTVSVLIGAFIAREFGIRHIWHVHEIIEKPVMFGKFIGKLLNRYSDKVIVVSDEVKKHWAKHVEARKLVRIYNGLDYGEFDLAQSNLKQALGLTDADILIGMIGRVNLWKGQQYFLEIAARLAPEYPNLRFVMAGDAYPGYEYLCDELKRSITEKALDKQVTYLGFRDDIPNVMNGLDLFMLPSILPDPLPTVVLEAMASAKPVIATRQGGSLEMVDPGVTGILIPWDDAANAAQLIKPLILDVSLRKMMGLEGKQRVNQNFSKAQYQQNILNLIDRL